MARILLLPSCETIMLHQARYVEVGPAGVPDMPSSIRAWIATADVLQQSASSEEEEGAPDAPGTANGLLDSDSDDSADLDNLRDDFGDSSMEESTGGDSEIGSEDEDEDEDLLPSERKSRKLERSRQVSCTCPAWCVCSNAQQGDTAEQDIHTSVAGANTSHH